MLGGTFPEDLKTDEIGLVYKKKKRTDNSNYRPVSILSNISKVYGKSFYNQMFDYFDRIFSKYQCEFTKYQCEFTKYQCGFTKYECGFTKYQCEFRKGRGPHHSLFYMMKQGGDDINVFAAVLADLSKVLDCINQELLIAKLNAFGFDSPSLKFIYAYLNFREQNTKVDSTFSDYLNILFGIPQGSIAGQLFYNIYTCDMFFQIDSSDFSSYEDDNTFCFRIEPRKTNKFFPKHSKWYV